MNLPAAFVGILLAAVAGAGARAAPPGPESRPLQLVGLGDTRPCYMKLAEPNVNGLQVGDVEVLAIATIGTDGRAVGVDIPALSELKIKPWARNRIQRWATCVVQSMSFEPAIRDGAPVESDVEIPLKSWTEVGRDQLQARSSVPAQLRSSAEELAEAYVGCVAPPPDAEYRVVYPFTIDEDGRARGVRVLDAASTRACRSVHAELAGPGAAGGVGLP